MEKIEITEPLLENFQNLITDKLGDKKVLETIQNTIEKMISKATFTVNIIDEGLAIFTPNNPKLLPIFKESWNYSVWDNPLICSNDKVRLNIESWKTRTVGNIEYIL